MKMICFGVRSKEIPFFNQLNRHHFELTLVENRLAEDNVDLVNGHKAVLVRGGCQASGANLAKMKEMGVEYLLTRTVGYDHIDLQEAKKMGFKMARVPSYSPNAIAELSLTLAMMLLRHTAEMVSNTAKGDFSVYPNYFSKEVRHQTIGVIGVGKIGLTSAKLFSGLGSKVIGNDPYPADEAKKIVNFMSLDELAAEADIIILHLPYIKGQNEHLINDAFLAKLKPEAILVNVARGELVDTAAVVKALKANKLAAFATDVLEDETKIFNKNFSSKATPSLLVDELVALYPRVLITPHTGSGTDEACRNMIEQSFDNLHDFVTTGTSKNSL